MREELKTGELFDCKSSYLEKLFSSCEYPWEILAKIKDYICEITPFLSSFTEIETGVFIGENVKIHPTASITGPAVIGAGTEVRAGAFIRGSVITGENCVIGNSCELKNCVLLNGVQVPHYNYVGDSVLGNGAHLGAGVICSNLKSDKKPVVIHGRRDYETKLRKLGAILGDGADVGCGCVLNPGSVIGKNTNVYPLVSVRGVVPPNSIVKAQNIIVSKQ